jgi:hypothetical protein
MNTHLNSPALGAAAAAVSALTMLILGILGNFGVYGGAVEMMRQWHMFFSLSVGGIIAGMLEAASISFVFIFILGWLYNRFN